jgi:2-iminobutanoate/2-iminopropanoate deaminase
MPERTSLKVIQSDQAPKAIGPYSAGIDTGHFIFTSGQLGIDPTTGTLAEGGIESETRQAIKNLEQILLAAGADLSSVVKTTVFLRSMEDFSAMNGVYGQYFKQNPPARSAIGVAALPKRAAVEIEAVALHR